MSEVRMYDDRATAMDGSDPDGVVQHVLRAPIAVNEMVLAVRSIVRGFGRSGSATPAVAVRVP